MVYLRFRDLHLDTAKCIDRFDQTAETDCYIIRDIQIQVHIQHGDRLLRTAFGICAVAFIITVIAEIQIRIAVYGNQLDLMGILIDTGNNDRIASGSFAKIPVSGIYAEQRDVPVTFQFLNLFTLYFRLYNFFIYDNIFRIDIRTFYFLPISAGECSNAVFS